MRPRTLSELTAVVPTDTLDRSVDCLADRTGQIGLAFACLAAVVLALAGLAGVLVALVTVAASAHSLLGVLVGWTTIVGLVAMVPTVVVRTVAWVLDAGA
jgi:hypothetical protein